MHRWLASVSLCIAGIGGAPAHELLEQVDACVARLDPQLDVGYERIASRCPQLTEALTHSASAAWLPADWNQPRNQLSSQGLTELRTLLSRSLAASVPARAPRPQTAAAVVARILPAEDAGQGWWSRFKAWLRKISSTGKSESGLATWLQKLNLSTGAVQAVVWLSLALVVAMAVAIIGNELRIAGVFKSRRRASADVGPFDRASNATGVLTDLERRDLREQPALLLQLIAATLTDLGRLPPARALTARELLGRARLTGDSDHAALEGLAVASERLRFSTQEFSSGNLTSAIAAGRDLLLRLSTAPPVAGEAAPHEA